VVVTRSRITVQVPAVAAISAAPNCPGEGVPVQRIRSYGAGLSGAAGLSGLTPAVSIPAGTGKAPHQPKRPAYCPEQEPAYTLAVVAKGKGFVPQPDLSRHGPPRDFPGRQSGGDVF
jgi:hypothetical protein